LHGPPLILRHAIKVRNAYDDFSVSLYLDILNHISKELKNVVFFVSPVNLAWEGNLEAYFIP